MARLSAASLRISNPRARITIVCDAETHRALRRANDPLPGDADEWLVCDTPPGDGAFRSKFIKTSLRERVAGPYLFVDVDTIVRDDLAPIWRAPGDIAGAPNHSREDLATQIWAGDQAMLDEMQWAIRPTFYMNSGVMLATESEGACRLYRLWHEKWQTSQRQLQDSRDQPSLNAAIRETNVECTRLAVRFNAQIGANPVVVRDAAIWHYNSSLEWQSYSHIDDLVRRTVQTGAVDVANLKELMESQALWSRPFWTAGPGVHMVNGSARDLAAAVASGKDAVRLVWAMRRTDPIYARQVLAKTMVDAYWGGQSEVYRFARNLLLRRSPLATFQPAVRRCLVHAAREKLKTALARRPQTH